MSICYKICAKIFFSACVRIPVFDNILKHAVFTYERRVACVICLHGRVAIPLANHGTDKSNIGGKSRE